MEHKQATSAPVESKKERKKRARSALVEFRDKLEGACGKLDIIDQWKDLASELDDLLRDYADVIPVQTQQRVDRLLKTFDPIDAGAQKACTILDKQVLDALHAVAPFIQLPVLAPATISAAIVAGVVVAYLHATAVEVTIVNNHCAPITMAQLPFGDWVGVQLPDKPIAMDSSDTARFPRVAIDVDATQPLTVALMVLGIKYSVTVAQPLKGLTLDEQILLGNNSRVNLGSRNEHLLAITCQV